MCIDANPSKIERLQARELTFHEPGLRELLEHCSTAASITFSTDLAAGAHDADVIFIAVGTPPQPSGEPDLRDLEEVARRLGSTLAPTKASTVVIKSTVPVGASQRVEMLIREGFVAQGTPSAVPFNTATVPSFLREGSAIQDTLYPSRVVLGSQSPEAIAALRALYAPILDQSFVAPAWAPRPEGFGPPPLVTADQQSAELIKLTANAFLATKLSFINEIANLCEKVGADIVEVARGVGLDERIGTSFLNAGAGWGGSRFGQDIAALISLAQEYGYEPHLLQGTMEVNRLQGKRILHKLQDRLKIVKGKTVGLLGLTYKPNTDDLRNAPALELAGQLLGLGARVQAYDPIAMPSCRASYPELAIHYAPTPEAAAEGCDALILMTEWDEFRGLPLAPLRERMRTPLLIDARNLLGPASAREAGFTYVGVGR